MLITSGVWNWVLNDTYLAPWKQFFILILYCCAPFFLLKSSNDKLLFIGVLIIQALLVLLSLLNESSLSYSIAYNIFYYGSWMPFYLISKNKILLRQLIVYREVIILFLSVSALGLVIDVKTDYFNLLNSRSYDNDYIESIGAAKRGVFIFVTSTFVMPLYTIISAIILARYYTNTAAATLTFLCIIAASCSATLSGFIALFIFILGIFSTVSSKDALFYIKFLMGVTGLLFLANFFDFKFFESQIDRVLANDKDSTSNVGRLILWEYAVNTIFNFTWVQHIAGMGIGSTNENFNSTSLPHGESSIFQAYLEGGILGVSMRLTPFFIALMHYRKNKLLSFTILGFFMACTVAPIFGHITNQALLGTSVGLLVLGNHALIYPAGMILNEYKK